MNKLEELGGLEAAKNFFAHLSSQECMTIGDDFGSALIDRIEELERELAEWRSSDIGESVKRTIRENSELLEARTIAQEACQKAQAKLQRYRELAEKVMELDQLRKQLGTVLLSENLDDDLMEAADSTLPRLHDEIGLCEAKARELLKED